MTIRWWKCMSVVVALLLAYPTLAQEGLVGGDNAVDDQEAEDAGGEAFDAFGLLGQSEGPSSEEQAEIDRLNADGQARAAQGDIEGALDAFEAASRIAPNFTSYYEFGRLLREQGSSLRAITTLASAIQQLRTLPPEEYATAATLTYTELGLAYLDGEEFNNAIQTFQQAQLIPGQRTNVELIYHQGLAQAELALNQQFVTSQARAEDLQTAITLFDRAIALNPNYAEALYERGSTYSVLGQADEAIEDLEKAVQLDPTNPETVAQYGFVSLRRGLAEGQSRSADVAQIKADLTMAINQFGRFLELIPQDREAEEELELEFSRESALISRSASFIALADEQTGEASVQLYQRAIADADTALLLVPDLPDAYFQKGLAYRMMNQFDPAIEAYTDALQINPANTEGLLRRGIVFFRQGDLALAKSDFIRAIRFSPDSNTRARFWLGLTFAGEGDEVRAIHEFNLAIRYQPFFTLAYMNRGLAHLRTGRFHRAIEDFTRVLGREPNNEKARVLRERAVAAMQ